ncbi:MAG: 5-formyltetrahydrofolate cyclo-ligase [Planctomycetota bacterium]
MTMPPPAESKAEFRRRFRRQRDALSRLQIEKDSEAIRHRVLGLDEVGAAETLFVYASTASEVQTYLLIEDLIAMRKTVAVPRITDKNCGEMEAVVIHSLKSLRPDEENFGLLTPRGGETLPQQADVALVPGLAFSPATGIRLGLGGGYYDRYLARTPGPASFRVGLAFEAQLEDRLPREPHDQLMHAVVTSNMVYRPAIRQATPPE